QPEITADIAAAFAGAPCPTCGTSLEVERGVEVGNIFKLGTKYSAGVGATYLDEAGNSNFIVMGSYGIGVGRMIASIAEACHDEKGLIWPASVAPFDVYLVGLDIDDESIRTRVEAVYQQLQDAGIGVLYDDRKERAGVKFNDADLLGMPIRLTVSRRTVQNESVELKLRSATDHRLVASEGIVSEVRSEIDRLLSEIRSRVVTETFG
ncbi:MAG: His/Gly/Thr/Pro-type tRNA ligase C-terminal domain-containing protein, partial [Chloroflexota bacterium]